MSVYIFVGPSLSVEDGCQILDAVYLPPVTQGDVYRVARQRPQVIGIIDGYFERVPAVWHKEILWAMSEGIHVFGAASMGALRAAELFAFGMEGAGLIWEAFRDGDLEDDDEVAVAHTSAANGYRAISEAMVNIRCTLGEAKTIGILSTTTYETLLVIAKNMFYAQRSYPLLLKIGRQMGLSLTELDELEEWLPNNRIDQKREDALSLLHLVHQYLDIGLQPKQVNYNFSYTDMWDAVMFSAGDIVLKDNNLKTAVTNFGITNERVLDELRLEGCKYNLALSETFTRALAVDETHRLNMKVTPSLLNYTGDNWCHCRNLLMPQQLQAWLREHNLTPHDFNRLLEEEARLEWMKNLMCGEIVYRLPNYLRINGQYSGLLKRALDKEQILTSSGYDNLALEEANITAQQLWDWYFESRLKVPVPNNLDEYARSVDWEDADMLRRAVLREYFYIQQKKCI